MKLQILASRLALSDALKEYVAMKLGVLARYLERFEKEGEKLLVVEIARSTAHHRHGDVYYAEATLRLPGKTLRAEHRNSDIHAAIDVVKDVMKIEIKKYKERLLNFQRGKRARE